MRSEAQKREDPGLSESATDFFHTGSDSTILHKEFYRINLGFKSPQTLFGSSGREERNSSQKRARGGPSLAEWAPKRLLQFGSGKQMLVKLVMPAGD